MIVIDRDSGNPIGLLKLPAPEQGDLLRLYDDGLPDSEFDPSGSFNPFEKAPLGSLARRVTNIVVERVRVTARVAQMERDLGRDDPVFMAVRKLPPAWQQVLSDDSMRTRCDVEPWTMDQIHVFTFAGIHADPELQEALFDRREYEPL